MMSSSSIASGLGLYVPDGMSSPRAGGATTPSASSSNVSVATFKSEPRPTSDMSITVTPVGPTSNMSMSAVKVCDIRRTVAVTLKSPAPMPDTSTDDGYNPAGPLVRGPAGTANGVELQKLVVVVGSDTVKSGRTALTVGAVGGTTSLHAATMVSAASALHRDFLGN